MNTRTTENNSSCNDKNDSVSDYPKTQFGLTYSFFRNPKPKPTLRAVKVHFDWTWILKLKRFFLRKFLSKNHLDKSPTYLGWILNFRVHNGTIKEKKMKKRDSRVKTQKDSLEQKMKRFQRKGRANKRMKG